MLPELNIFDGLQVGWAGVSPHEEGFQNDQGHVNRRILVSRPLNLVLVMFDVLADQSSVGLEFSFSSKFSELLGERKGRVREDHSGEQVGGLLHRIR